MVVLASLSARVRAAVTPRRGHLLAFLAVLALTAACRTTVVREATPRPVAAPAATGTPDGGAASAASPTGPSPVAIASPVPPRPIAVGSPTVGAAASPPAAACGFGQTRRLAEAEDRAIKEASALVASRRWPGILWTLNDSGNTPTLYALDEEGRSRGTFRVEGASNEDWEALQLGPGRDGGQALYIGDIGDNDGRRRELTIYRVPEPQPVEPGPRITTGRTAAAEAFKIAYPSGARDAETLLVHPQTGEILLLTKEHLGRTAVYRVPVPLDGRRVNRMEKVGDVDLAPHGGKADLLTDGAVSADARRVMIRTYGSAFEYDVPPGAALATIWNQPPRASKMDDGPQGESITYRADGSAVISIGEGSPARLYLTPRGC